MRWYGDEYDEAYNDLLYICDESVEDEEEIQHDDSSMYFDVPLVYRPIQTERRIRK